MNQTDKEKFQNDCYEYMAALAKVIYENEERRENSLIQQAGHMQAVFSFVIMAEFTLLPTLIAHRGALPLKYIVIVFSLSSIALIVSVVFATMAQKRMTRKDFPTVESMEKEVIGNYGYFVTSAQRNKYLVDLFKTIHKSCVSCNDDRVVKVRISMYAFYVAIVLCVLGYLGAILNVCGGVI